MLHEAMAGRHGTNGRVPAANAVGDSFMLRKRLLRRPYIVRIAP
jgi:hypothetical protein